MTYENLSVNHPQMKTGGALSAHRGYWTAPESAQNSLASFTKADAVGVYGSEINVWLTADNKPIVAHCSAVWECEGIPPSNGM